MMEQNVGKGDGKMMSEMERMAQDCMVWHRIVGNLCVSSNQR